MEKNNEFGNYFSKILLDKEPLTPQYKVAEKLGVKQGTMSKLKTGTLIPSDSLAQKIAEVWNLNIDELMQVVYKARQESGARFFRETQQKAELAAEVVRMPTKPRLPVSAAAGRLSMYIEGVMQQDCEQLPIIRSLPNYDFTMFIKGNSMEPKYESGDEIALKKANSIIEWGKDYVLDTEDGAIFKKIYEEGDNIRCVSYNKEEYPDFLVPKSAVYGFYRFVGLIRV